MDNLPSPNSASLAYCSYGSVARDEVDAAGSSTYSIAAGG